MRNHIINKTNDYKGNAVLLMPIAALPRYTSNFSDNEQTIIESVIEKLAKKYHFLGELVFEDKKSLGKLGIDETSLPLLSTAMQKLGIDIDTVQVYNLWSELKTIRETPIPTEHGTARKDKIRNFLNSLFHNELNKDETVGKLISGSLDSSNNLVLRFNVSADLKQTLEENKITSSEIMDAVNGTLKRVIRRAFLKAVKSTVPTDNPEMVEMLDSQSTTSIVLNEGMLKCIIPLTAVTQGAFSSKLITQEDVSDAIKSEIGYGIQLATSLKAKHN